MTALVVAMYMVPVGTVSPATSSVKLEMTQFAHSLLWLTYRPGPLPSATSLSTTTEPYYHDNRTLVVQRHGVYSWGLSPCLRAYVVVGTGNIVSGRKAGVPCFLVLSNARHRAAIPAYNLVRDKVAQREEPSASASSFLDLDVSTKAAKGRKPLQGHFSLAILRICLRKNAPQLKRLRSSIGGELLEPTHTGR